MRDVKFLFSGRDFLFVKYSYQFYIWKIFLELVTSFIYCTPLFIIKIQKTPKRYLICDFISLRFSQDDFIWKKSTKDKTMHRRFQTLFIQNIILYFSNFAFREAEQNYFNKALYHFYTNIRGRFVLRSLKKHLNYIDLF